jgi:hypothetical protein
MGDSGIIGRLDEIAHRFVFWLVWRGPINLGPLAPPLFGWAIRAKGWRKVDDDRVDPADRS